MTPQQFCVRSGCVFIGNEDRLIILQNDDKPEIIKIRGRIRSIISLGSNSSDPIAVATMQGVDVVWKPNFSPHVESVVSNFAEPKLGVTANQRLLVANQQQIDLFQVNREGTHIIWQATYSLPKTPPLAILTVNNWDQIAMLFYGGTLHHYQLPMNSVAYAMADE
ncbi:MAG: hypothetical protein JW829_13250 [Pirellulales bacterium]|nr:hypothetical protein [Pirellulales bacterium]